MRGTKEQGSQTEGEVLQGGDLERAAEWFFQFFSPEDGKKGIPISESVRDGKSFYERELFMGKDRRELSIRRVKNGVDGNETAQVSISPLAIYIRYFRSFSDGSRATEQPPLNTLSALRGARSMFFAFKKAFENEDQVIY